MSPLWGSGYIPPHPGFTIMSPLRGFLAPTFYIAFSPP
jgi:hypothetical protein